MKENYKCSEEQREKMRNYYWIHRKEILQKQRENYQNKNKKHNTLQDMYYEWNLYILERLQSPNKLPIWIQKMMINQVIQNNNRINEMENQK